MSSSYTGGLYKLYDDLEKAGKGQKKVEDSNLIVRYPLLSRNGETGDVSIFRQDAGDMIDYRMVISSGGAETASIVMEKETFNKVAQAMHAVAAQFTSGIGYGY